MSNSSVRSLLRQVELFQTIINHACAVIGAKDLDGRYIFVNEEYSRLFHRNKEEFIGKTDYELSPNDISKAFREADKLVIATQKTNTLEEKVLVNDELRYFLSVKFPIFDDEGKLFATGLVATDITERKISELEIRELALTDQLTQISNRNHFNQCFDNAMKLAKRENKKLAILMLDLDKFKSVNDAYGHPAGDKLLHHVASLIKKTCREIDIVARLGGDEFAIILIHPVNKKDIQIVVQRIIDEVAKPIHIAEHRIQIGVSLGIAIFPDDDVDKEKLMIKADLALYRAKRDGRNTFVFYESMLG